ncbi:TIGR04211 family SH3 domain-containing protein [Vibrio breoganii]|uniref:Arylsulfatase n=1 Tax=Vibrio breoganii TaxID=553239 RepID=A0AAJ5EK45_9VIBR|nr:TIGR04211 family SH3 domain-containing protein [Vibrio breoganii]ANO32040.1 arylsulfatase [Vibrio breoganii]MDN3716369.1 TIGR04211 family SH3 domain-containing protein [Vibrio breoganii]NMO72591.1 SH3 domain-containing protein [Vibrio breoganii]NMR69175.1 SH3 domain-containing protein [Vibrio breoganii]OCH73084.1 arylsulfatase [Vibrio breoganii]
MKKLFLIALAAVMTAPAAWAQTRYISDNLFTYMHSGPNAQYRIIGSVDAGAAVTLVQTNKNSGYTEVVDQRGRKGWVESKYVTNTEGMATRMPRLEKELAQVKAELAGFNEQAEQEQEGLVRSLETRNSQISEMEVNYKKVSDQLLSAQTEVRELRARLDTQKEDLLLKYFMYGGGVAGLGLLFGLLLPHVIPRRKKSPNGWA